MQTQISVVLPVYNEREVLEVLTERLIPVLENSTNGLFEVIFVDDNSSDGSDKIIENIHNKDCRFKSIIFSRNFGHQSALQAGIDAASGLAVILMDSDLQDPPELLTEFIKCWKQGYDVVYAIRRKRKESIFKRFAYASFYRSMKFISEIEVPLDAGDFCLMDRKVVHALVSMRERNRFIRGLRSWVGFKQTGIEYEREARFAGETKYSLRKLITLALSGYIGFSGVPLRIATWFGIFTATAGFLSALWAIITKFFLATPQGWVSLMSVTMLVGGVQLIILGIIGEYLSRVYDEVRERPLYLISSTLGFKQSENAFSLTPQATNAKYATNP